MQVLETAFERFRRRRLTAARWRSELQRCEHSLSHLASDISGIQGVVEKRCVCVGRCEGALECELRLNLRGENAHYPLTTPQIGDPDPCNGRSASVTNAALPENPLSNFARITISFDLPCRPINPEDGAL